MALWAVGLALLCLLAWWCWGHKAALGRLTGGRRQQRQPGPAGEGHGDGVTFAEERGTPVGDCWLICKPSALAQALLKSFCRSAELEAKRWSWKSWPNLQTVMQLLWPPGHPLEFARDHLQLADKGLVALDWVVGPSDRGRKATDAAESLVLLVVPNATGRITRNIQQLCRQALQQGYYPVIFNRRGHNGCPLTSPKLQPFGDPADLKEAVAYIRFRHPTSTLFAVSEGSGSGLLLSYLGECGSSSYLGGATCISPLLKVQDWFEIGIPWLYEWSLLLFQKRSISRYAKALKEVVEMDRVLESRSLQAFEEALFCHHKSQGSSWVAYWDANEPLRDVDEVAVPVLCLCSADDPIRGAPDATLPWELFQSNPFLFLLLSPHGGHCGFLGRESDSWGNAVILEYLRTLVEFFRGEKRMKERPHCGMTTAHHRCRRGTPQSREALLPTSNPFSWQRSYTH
ncbi:protein ABHD15 [Rhineura floridana]|uniref:protein ABHD15 n=1 Tax=Rhineura floridana TaxID=261503 RepID=UPI002AC86389|nr:protein ABHD15 [Rhineura floridana]